MATLVIPNLEYSLTSSCNLRCRHCSFRVPDQARPHLPVRPEHFVADLDLLLAADAGARCFRLLGGEALLSPHFAAIAAIAAACTALETVEVITNGLLVARAPTEVWERFDTIGVSLYPVTDGLEAPLLAYFACLGLADRVRIIRRTWDRQDPLDPPASVEQAAEAFAGCEDRHFCATLEAGRLYRCSRAAKWGDESDGLDLRAARPSDVEAYLFPSRCPTICTTCRPKLAYEVVPRGQQAHPHAPHAERLAERAERELRAAVPTP